MAAKRAAKEAAKRASGAAAAAKRSGAAKRGKASEAPTDPIVAALVAKMFGGGASSEVAELRHGLRELYGVVSSHDSAVDALLQVVLAQHAEIAAMRAVLALLAAADGSKRVAAAAQRLARLDPRRTDDAVAALKALR